VRLVDQQLSISRQASWTTVYILPFAAVAIAYANRDWASLGNLIAWPALVALSCFGSELAQKIMLHRIDEGSPHGVRMRSKYYVMTTIATSLAWSLMAVFLWAPGQMINHMFLILILASTISGWTSLGASHLASAFASMPIYLVVQVGMPLSTGNSRETMLAFLCAGFWVIMMGLLYANYQTRARMLRLEMERGPLVDDLRRAKAESDRARDRAEQASRAKSSFLANMSHELRTPLNAILGFSEIIHTRALGVKAQDQYAEYGGFIHDSGRHLLALITDILDLAKIEAGRFTLREEEVNLSRLISEASLMLAVKAKDGGIEMATDTPVLLPNVYGDERALRQMLVNLLSNAVKFTPAGGRVAIFANVTESGGLCFGVSDTGVGIDIADQQRVFESFGQGRHDAVIADQGTGLGLPIVKGLAEAHSGSIALESAPGKGTKVTVTLPAERVRPRNESAAA
jgi:two-component system cell cycle sensor histidine kinase PleC